MPKILFGLIIFSGACCILFEYWGPRWLFYTFKPLTMVLIILIPILRSKDLTIYPALITLGLGFALVGDVLLMIPSDRFLSGVVAFLGTHICYILAISNQIGEFNWIPLLPLVLLGILVMVILTPAMERMKYPVYLYTLIIIFMVWMAWERWFFIPAQESLLILIGACLFAGSDLVLIVNKYLRKFRIAQVLTLGMYFTAQLLFATSAILIS